jgi:hypothetical protein
VLTDDESCIKISAVVTRGVTAWSQEFSRGVRRIVTGVRI